MLSQNVKSVTSVSIIDPVTKEKSIARPNRGSIQRTIGLHRQTQMFEFCYLIAGFKPPVNNIGFHEDGLEALPPEANLLNPTFIFRGLNRPYVKDGADDNVYVFCLRIEETYKYSADMVCVAKLVPAPTECLFAVYLHRDSEGNLEIYSWEWIEAGSDGKPLDSAERYTTEIIL